MKYSIPGLGGRLRRARNGTGLSQVKVAEHIGVSWMTVHRWERSQRNVPDHLLDRLCELYDKPLDWFLTLEEGDLVFTINTILTVVPLGEMRLPITKETLATPYQRAINVFS